MKPPLNVVSLFLPQNELQHGQNYQFCRTAHFDIREMGKEVGVSHRIIDALLTEFERRGFMAVDRMPGGHVYVDLTVRAHDFVQQGGYGFEEKLAAFEMEKLVLEGESLQGAIPQAKYNTIFGAVSALAGILGLAKGT